MLFYEVKDIVREHLSRTTFPTSMLDAALTNGRQIVEQAGNWWWMRAEADFNTVIRQQVYPINTTGQPVGLVTVRGFPPSTTSASGSTSTTEIQPSFYQVQPIDVIGFKDIRAAIIKKKTDLEWAPLDTGGVTKEECDLHYALNDTGMPNVLIIDNFNIYTYPPMPDTEYIIRLYHWKWTANPLSNLATDDLIDRFSYALIYAALCWAYELELKDMQTAAYWRQLLGGKPDGIGNGGELAKIREHNLKRQRQDKMSLVPMFGPNARVRRLRLTQNIWIGSGGNL